MFLGVIILFKALRLINGDAVDAYLWVYFTGNSANEEQIRFAISTDGFDFTALNNNQPVIKSVDIAEKKAIRDPHILRAEDGETFYIVATDMMSSQGWRSNVGIVMLKSKDLINWTSSRVNIQTSFPDDFGDIDRAWAPQTIWDPVEKKYMVYFSMEHTGGGEGSDRIFYSYANENFTALETVPKQLYFPEDGYSTIDADIIPLNGKYFMFYRTQRPDGSEEGLRRAVSNTSITGPYVLPDPKEFVELTADNVEGSCVYRLADGGFVLIYDVYNNGRYEFCLSKDLMTFTPANRGTTSGFSPRHGTVVGITMVEMDRLIAKWG